MCRIDKAAVTAHWRYDNDFKQSCVDLYAAVYDVHLETWMTLTVHLSQQINLHQSATVLECSLKACN